MTHNLARIVGRSWTRLEGQTLFHRNVDIVGCGDIHPFPMAPKFPDTEKVFMRHCDKNFVFHWLNRRTFPKVTEIYLASHPCEYPVAHRFSKQAQLFMVDGYYRQYWDRWWTKQDSPHISPISFEKLKLKLKRVEEGGLDLFDFLEK